MANADGSFSKAKAKAMAKVKAMVKSALYNLTIAYLATLAASLPLGPCPPPCHCLCKPSG